MKVVTILASLAFATSTLARERVVVDGGAPRPAAGAGKTRQHSRSFRRWDDYDQWRMCVYQDGDVAYNEHTGLIVDAGVIPFPPISTIEIYDVPDGAQNCRLEFQLDSLPSSIAVPDGDCAVDVFLLGDIPTQDGPFDPSTPAPQSLGSLTIVDPGNSPENNVNFDCEPYANSKVAIEFRARSNAPLPAIITWDDDVTGPILHVTP